MHLHRILLAAYTTQRTISVVSYPAIDYIFRPQGRIVGYAPGYFP